MFDLIKRTASDFIADKCPRMAAALSYYTVFSLAPLLILLIATAGIFFDPSDVEGRVASEISAVIGADGAQQVREMLRSVSSSDKGTLAKILSVLGLFLGASGVVLQLQEALNQAWGVRLDPAKSNIWTVVQKRLLSLGMVLGLGFILIVSMAMSAVITLLDERLVNYLPGALGDGTATMMNTFMTVVILTGLFSAMFKILPDAKIQWRDVSFGAFITACLFIVGKYALGAYFGSRNMATTFGAAGSLALILVWVYYSAMIFFLGAEFTQAWANSRGREILPEQGALKIK